MLFAPLKAKRNFKYSLLRISLTRSARVVFASDFSNCPAPEKASPKRPGLQAAADVTPRLLGQQAPDLYPSASWGMLNSESFQPSLTSAAVPRRPQRTS